MKNATRLALALFGVFLLVTASGCDSGRCGNGRPETGEQCDDGNTDSGDGCSATCATEPRPRPRCGDGKLEDGRASATTATSSTATAARTTARPRARAAAATASARSARPATTATPQDGDGCESDCTLTAGQRHPVRRGQHGAAGQRGHLRGDARGQRRRLFTGMVLKDGETLQGGQVLVDDKGVIQCSACDCSATAGAAEATVVSCPEGVISPGLINAHDHITYQGAPYARTAERYEHRHDWRTGHTTATRELPADNATNDSIRWGELRQVMAGTTSVAGSGGQAGPAAQPGQGSVTTTGGNQEGLDEPRASTTRPSRWVTPAARS